MRFPSVVELAPVLFDEEEAKRFLVDKGVITAGRRCTDCGLWMNLDITAEKYRHNCDGKSRTVSMWKGTIFYKKLLKSSQMLMFGHFWLSGCSHTQISMLGGFAAQTVTDNLRLFNALAAMTLPRSACVIGGQDVIVEVDESKLSKRKYNSGHHVEGVWVIGGVERTTERKLFAVEVENRKADTIYDVLTAHVLPGSVIHTDLWRGYNWLDASDDYVHRTVNHSRGFKDPITGVHTNSIEGTWAAIKAKISKRNRTMDSLRDHLFAFMWRRQHEGRLWEAFLEALKPVSDLE
jgi:transposase-like protein